MNCYNDTKLHHQNPGVQIFSPFLQFARGALETSSTWIRQWSHVNSANPFSAKRIVMVTATRFYSRKHFGWFLLEFSYPNFELLYWLNFTCRFYSAFGFSLLLFSLFEKSSPKEHPKREKEQFLCVGIPACFVISFNFGKFQPRAWMNFLLFAPCQASMLFVLHISKINKQSHNRESPGTRATLMKAGPRSLIKGRVPRSKPRKHFKPKQWGVARRKWRRWLQRPHGAFPATHTTPGARRSFISTSL